MGSGNMENIIECRNAELQELGKNINNIKQGMKKAVEESMKAERLKTDLITNVSHDLKTPLTSIINYTDLLKKEKIENENVNKSKKNVENENECTLPPEMLAKFDSIRNSVLTNSKFK